MVERIIFRTYLYPAFDRPLINEQLRYQPGFRRAGSNTAAIMNLLQNISNLLRELMSGHVEGFL